MIKEKSKVGSEQPASSQATLIVLEDVLCRIAFEGKSADTKQQLSLISGSSLVNRFFREWYSVTTFVFRKNIKVTNVMLAELVSLVRIHSHYRANIRASGTHSDTTGEERARPGGLYESSRAMKEIFVELWNSLEPESDDPEEMLRARIKAFVRHYGDFFCDTIPIDPYAGSCLVFAPKTVALDYRNICAESGYIYSCGPTIYMRRSNKVRLSSLRKKLYRWLVETDAHTQSEYKVPIIVLSREQFPPSGNNDIRRMEHNGIEDLKFHLDKYFFESVPISTLLRALTEPTDEYDRKSSNSEVLNTLKQRLEPWIERHSGERRPGLRTNEKGEEIRDHDTSLLKASSRSIFFQVEKPLQLQQPMEPLSRYFLCFVQEYTNRSQLYEIDEAKPGWTAPVTIPHTLATAMLNIARGALPRGRRRSIRVLDPFCGAGTFALEATRLPGISEFQGSDIYPLNKRAYLDNLNILQWPVSDRARFLRDIATAIGANPEVPITSERWIDEAIRQLRATDETTQRHTLQSILDGPKATARSRNSGRDVEDTCDKIRWAFSNARSEFRTGIRPKESEVPESGGFSPHIQFEDYRRVVDHWITDKVLNLLNESDLESRLLFYIFWKAFVTNAFFIHYSAPEFDDTIHTHDHKALGFAFQELVKFLERWSRINFIDNSPLVDASNEQENPHLNQNAISEGHIERKGFYSTKLTVDWRNIEAIAEYTTADIQDLDVNRQYDVIVTDPPYGFNVAGEALTTTIPDLYAKLAEVMVMGVRDGGQVVFCVPDAPMNGQTIPFYMTKGFIVKQFMIAARKHGREVRRALNILPQPKNYFVPPYYWESERALRRVVLHFSVYDTTSSNIIES